MVVSYVLNGERFTKEVRGSGKLMKILGLAKDIEVYFEIRPPSWGVIFK